MAAYGGSELVDLELPGPRLLLRPWRPADAERLVAIMSEPPMHEFLARPRPFGTADATDFLTGPAQDGRSEGTGFTSAVVERDSGRLVGLGTLQWKSDAQIDCWIAPDARGRGYAVEVTRALTDWAFTHGLPRVGIGCDVRNLASARTALAAGFQFEGIRRDAHTGISWYGRAALRGDRAEFGRLPDDPGDPVPPRVAPLPEDGLTDGVVSLRVTAPEDATGLFETDDETTLAWSFTGEPHTMGQARRTSAQAGLIWLVGGVAQLTMVDVASGDYAGELHLRSAGPPGVGALGYMVHPRFRGRGYTARALRLLVPWAFSAGVDFARLELGAKSGNLASQRAALGAGFAPDGTLRTRLRTPDGTFSDETRFVLLNPRHAGVDPASG